MSESAGPVDPRDPEVVAALHDFKLVEAAFGSRIDAPRHSHGADIALESASEAAAAMVIEACYGPSGASLLPAGSGIRAELEFRLHNLVKLVFAVGHDIGEGAEGLRWCDEPPEAPDGPEAAQTASGPAAGRETDDDASPTRRHPLEAPPYQRTGEGQHG